MDPMNERSAADELAAAEAELKAAQERLDAARLRMASEQPQPYAQSADAPVDSQGGAIAAAAVCSGAAGVVCRSACSVGIVWLATAASAADSASHRLAARCATGAGPALRAATRRPAAGQPYAAPQQGSPYAQPQPQAQATQQPYGAQPGYGSAPPQNPYGQQAQYGYQQPYVAPAVGEKDHVAAGLLALFLGWLGVHKFYLGYNTSGFIMLGTSILGGILTLSVASWAIWVIAIVEGIFYLSKSQTEFEQMYVINKQEWF